MSNSDLIWNLVSIIIAQLEKDSKEKENSKDKDD